MNLSWFRMYTDAVDDEKLRLLAFEDRWHFVALLCCKAKGLLDSGDDPEMLSRKLSVKLGLQSRDLDEVKRRLKEVGLVDDNFQPLAWGRRQYSRDSSAERTKKYRDKKYLQDVTECDASHVTDVTVTVTGTETETDTSSLLCKEEVGADASPCPHNEIIDLYHELLPSLPRVAEWNSERQKLLRARWRESKKRQNLEWWRRYFSYVARCDFLVGNVQPHSGRQPFFANLEWLVRPNNLLKVIEGRYENRDRKSA